MIKQPALFSHVSCMLLYYYYQIVLKILYLVVFTCNTTPHLEPRCLSLHSVPFSQILQTCASKTSSTCYVEKALHKNIPSKRKINKACGLCCICQHSPNSNVLICIIRSEMMRTLFYARYKWKIFGSDVIIQIMYLETDHMLIQGVNYI